MKDRTSPTAERPSIATPQESTSAFAGALNAGQLDLATTYFAADGCLITPDATAVRGHDGIRSVGEGADPFVHSTTPTLLLRRFEADWKLAIAAPWGLGERG